MLADFDNSVEKLREAYLKLGNCLAETGLVRFTIRVQAAELAFDILSFCPVFREIHTQAVMDSLEQTRLLNADWPPEKTAELFKKMEKIPDLLKSEVPQEEFNKFFDDMPKSSWSYEQSIQHIKMTDQSSASLRAAYKAIFYFIRAYHDSLYKILLEILGQHAGRHSAMSAAFDFKKRDFKAGNLVSQKLGSSYPGYLDWFLNWREKRNLIKEGVGCGYAGPSNDLGIAFTTVNAKGEMVTDCTKPIRLSDIIDALTSTTKVMSIALEEGMQRHKKNP